MHQATKINIIGQISVIKQCLMGIEAAIAADQYQQVIGGKPKADSLTSDDDSEYLNEREEDALGLFLGLGSDDAKEEKPKKRARTPGVSDGEKLP